MKNTDSIPGDSDRLGHFAGLCRAEAKYHGTAAL